jgi:hypothetical protein
MVNMSASIATRAARLPSGWLSRSRMPGLHFLPADVEVKLDGANLRVVLFTAGGQPDHPDDVTSAHPGLPNAEGCCNPRRYFQEDV